MRRYELETLILSVAISAMACASGATVVRMATSEQIPAARGTVKTVEVDNGNTSLEVEVHHLAMPERVAPGATTYVVWATPLGAGGAQNLGALRVDGNLRGTLKTVTPLRSFRVFITAERSPTSAEPANQRLFTATVSGRSR